MPYIKDEDRRHLARGAVPANPGELNYAITKLCIAYLARGPLNYTTLNEIVGAMESAKCEFQRRIVGPYEENKRQENGDVYTLYW